MYGSNPRGFTAAVITGGLIGVSGTAAGLRAVPPSEPLSPTRPEPRNQGAPVGPNDSESAVDRIFSAGTAEPDGRSMQVNFGQQAPREPGDRPTGYDSPAPGMSGGPGGYPGAPVASRFPNAVDPRQSQQSYGQQSYGQQPGARPSVQQPSGAPFGAQPTRPAGQQFGGAEQTYRLEAMQGNDQRSYPNAPANSATVALAAHRPGPLDHGGASASNTGYSGTSDPLDSTYQLPVEARAPYSDQLMDRISRTEGPGRAGEQSELSDRGVSAGGSHHAAAGSRTVADLVASTGGHYPAAGSGGRRARSEPVEEFPGLRVVPDASDQPVGGSGAGGYSTAREQPTDYRRDTDNGIAVNRALREASSSGGYRAVAEGPGGTALATPPGIDPLSSPTAQPQTRLHTGFDAYGAAAPEVELGELDRGNPRSGMFMDRSVESSLPTAAVLSQRFSAESTGGHRAVDRGREIAEQRLAEPRKPRHDNVTPPRDLGSERTPPRDLGSERTSALGSLDSSGLFGDLSSHQSAARRH